jgi:hypothetical protein
MCLSYLKSAVSFFLFGFAFFFFFEGPYSLSDRKRLCYTASLQQRRSTSLSKRLTTLTPYTCFSTMATRPGRRTRMKWNEVEKLVSKIRQKKREETGKNGAVEADLSACARCSKNTTRTVKFGTHPTMQGSTDDKNGRKTCARRARLRRGVPRGS